MWIQMAMGWMFDQSQTMPNPDLEVDASECESEIARNGCNLPGCRTATVALLSSFLNSAFDRGRFVAEYKIELCHIARAHSAGFSTLTTSWTSFVALLCS